MIIGPDSIGYAKKGMTFNVNMGIQGIENPLGTGEDDDSYAIHIGDTCLVNDSSPATIISSVMKEINNVGIFIQSENKLICLQNQRRKQKKKSVMLTRIVHEALRKITAQITRT